MGNARAAGTVRIRPLAASDLRRVMEIETASFTTPWRRSTFEGLLARGDADLFAAADRDTLIGYAVCWTILDQAELGNVAVDPDHRGRGVGGMLVDAAVERARARGARECFLEVRDSNRAARALYESRGFEVIGRRRRYYSRPVEDALVMRLHLL